MKCLQKLVWDIWKWVARFRQDVRDNLPLMLCVLFSIQSFVIYETEFYVNYYDWFDYLDTFIYVIIVYDLLNQIYKNIVFEHRFRYNETNAVSCLVLLALLFLNVLFYQFEFKDYINIYKSILIGGAIGIILTYIKE